MSLTPTLPTDSLVASIPIRQTAAPEQVLQFLARVSSLAAKDEHQAVDVVFDFLDDQLLASNFALCDSAFLVADPRALPPSVVVSFLMVTRRAAAKLPSREQFLVGAIDAIVASIGAAEAESLLGKYR